MMPEKNGKWALAFWIMATICVGGGVLLTNNVIANDRMRQEGDEKLRCEIARMIEVQNSRYIQIIGDLREIKTKIGIRTQDYNGLVSTRN
jgi:hypothetical protein